MIENTCDSFASVFDVYDDPSGEQEGSVVVGGRTNDQKYIKEYSKYVEVEDNGGCSGVARPYLVKESNGDIKW